MTTVAERAERVEIRTGLSLPSISSVEEQIKELAKYCDEQADKPLRANVHVSRMEWRDLADQLWKVVEK